MCDIIKKEFKLKNFSLNHGKLEAFSTAQWKTHPAVFVCYRILVSVYTVACFVALVISSVNNNGNARLFAFLTIWTYLLLCIYFLLSAIIAVGGYTRREYSTKMNDVASIMEVKIPDSTCQEPHQEKGIINTVFENEIGIASCHGNGYTNGTSSGNSAAAVQNGDIVLREDLPWYTKLSWLLGNIVYVFAPVVTIVYFTALFPYIGVNGDFIHDLNMHAFNTVVILIDVFMSARPFRLLHVIYPTIYGITYIIFSAIFWSTDKINNVLYPNVLDWNHPGTTAVVLVCLAFIGIPLVQLAHFGLFRLRLLLYRKTYSTDYF